MKRRQKKKNIRSTENRRSEKRGGKERIKGVVYGKGKGKNEEGKGSRRETRKKEGRTR